MFGAFRSVHSESFERTQAENVAAKWERFARTAADLGETALWQTAKHGADRIRTLRDIDAIEAEHAAPDTPAHVLLRYAVRITPARVAIQQLVRNILRRVVEILERTARSVLAALCLGLFVGALFAGIIVR